MVTTRGKVCNQPACTVSCRAFTRRLLSRRRDSNDLRLVHRDRFALAAERDCDGGVFQKESPHVIHEPVAVQVCLKAERQASVRQALTDVRALRARAAMLALVSTLLPSASLMALSNWVQRENSDASSNTGCKSAPAPEPSSRPQG